MPKTSETYKRPRLTVLEELTVLGGHYLISRGATASGNPVVYISGGRGKPGLTILAQNARAFQAALARALNKFPEVDGEGVMQPAEVGGHSSCPSQQDEDWRCMTLESGNDSKIASTMLAPHKFEAGVNTVTGAPFTTCDTCGYDTTKVKEYAAWGKQAKGSKRKARRA